MSNNYCKIFKILKMRYINVSKKKINAINDKAKNMYRVKKQKV